VATPAELDEDRRRWLAAKVPPPRPKPDEGNLVGVLRLFAAWKPCASCGARVLFVNSQARTDGDVVCGICQLDPAKKLRRPSLPLRMAMHLRSLWTANDNAAVPNAS
jgi:hypothetical protein